MVSHTLQKSFFYHKRAFVYINYITVSRGLVISGITTLNEGDILYLDCDATTLKPRASVKWLSPEGVVVSKKRILEIMNIQRSSAGIYTCVATQQHILNTTSSVNVTVQCEHCNSVLIEPMGIGDIMLCLLFALCQLCTVVFSHHVYWFSFM